MPSGIRFNVVRIVQRNQYNAYEEPTGAPPDPDAEQMVQYLTSDQRWCVSIPQAVILTMAQAQLHARVHGGDILEAW